MRNNALLNNEQALGSDQILKVSALLYLKEALINQEYESCQELIDTAKNLGVDAGDISAVIADYLSATNRGGPAMKYGGNADGPGRQKANRFRS